MVEPTRFFHPVLPARALGRKPVRVLLAGRPYVLFRDHHGHPGALHDRCPHRFAPLSLGHVRPDGRLACAYHGWHFDRHGHGLSPSQPGLRQCDVHAMQLVERHRFLWLADLTADPAHICDPRSDDYQYAGHFSTRFDAPLHLALDNFSEDEHTPWVHTRLGWQQSDLDSIDFSATNHPDRTEVRYTARQRPSLLTRLLLLRPGDLFHNVWHTRFDPVRTVYAIYWTCPRTGLQRPISIRATVYMVPEDPHRTHFHTLVTLRLAHPALRRLAPLIHRLALGLGRRELDDDARFLRHLADTPESMAGMRLGKFDKPLIHNRKLLRTLYWGQPDPT